VPEHWDRWAPDGHRMSGAPPDPNAAADLAIDVSLLSGFGFTCRPDCGLCCFASPRLDPLDEQRLRAVAPDVRVEREDGERCIASRPEGGACQFLHELRCRVHSARPAPCREYPVSVHIGTRLQATLVLACPGLPLEPLRSDGIGRRSHPPSGLDTELQSVRSRLTTTVERRRREAERRRRKLVRLLDQQGRWVDEEEVRHRLRGRRLIPTREEYRPDGLPDVGDGLERLPMYFDQRAGPVVLAEAHAGWEALELSPLGGGTSLGLAAPPDQPPTLEGDAASMLEGYLRYWLERDCFLAAVHLDMQSADEGNVEETALEELHAIASDVIARAAVRVQLRGRSGARLQSSDIELGIRATDQDWLDRPTWGSRL